MDLDPERKGLTTAREAPNLTKIAHICGRFFLAVTYPWSLGSFSDSPWRPLFFLATKRIPQPWRGKPSRGWKPGGRGQPQQAGGHLQKTGLAIERSVVVGTHASPKIAQRDCFVHFREFNRQPHRGINFGNKREQAQRIPPNFVQARGCIYTRYALAQKVCS